MFLANSFHADHWGLTDEIKDGVVDFGARKRGVLRRWIAHTGKLRAVWPGMRTRLAVI